MTLAAKRLWMATYTGSQLRHEYLNHVIAPPAWIKAANQSTGRSGFMRGVGLVGKRFPSPRQDRRPRLAPFKLGKVS
jgi:hypothetical protein